MDIGATAALGGSLPAGGRARAQPMPRTRCASDPSASPRRTSSRRSLRRPPRRTRAIDVKAGLGNTAIVYEALRSGSIDLYPEYVGTIDLEILKNKAPSPSLDAMNRQLAPLGLGVAIAARLQRRLRAGDARGRRAKARHPHAQRSCEAPRSAPRPVERIHRPCRRLEGPRAALRVYASAARASTTASPTTRWPIGRST